MASYCMLMHYSSWRLSQSFLLIVVVLYSTICSLCSCAVLELPLGFNMSLNMILEQTNYCVPAYPPDANFKTHDPFFVPFLTSDGFMSDNDTQSYGFALGLLYRDGWYQGSAFLTICGGLSGSINETTRAQISYKLTDDKSSKEIYQIPDGYAVRSWKLDHAINDSRASLVVVRHGVSDKPQLQLRDGHDRTLWNVPDVGMMEMLDNGTLVIYDSATNSSNYNYSSNKMQVVWQSTINGSDVLFGRQKLMLGQQLTSNNSAYSAVVESDGFSLRMNSIGSVRDPTYAFFSFDSLGNSFDSCTPANSGTYVTYVTSFSGGDPGGDLVPYLQGSSCSMQTVTGARDSTFGSGFLIFSKASYNLFDLSFSFLNLGNDGRLYIVSVFLADTSYVWLSDGYYNQTQIFPNEIFFRTNQSKYSSYLLQGLVWPWCDIPTACGDLSICTPPLLESPDPKDNSMCSCRNMDGHFYPMKEGDPSKGCFRIMPLPKCNTQYKRSPSLDQQISFIELKNIASIFLFSNSPKLNTSLIFANMANECENNCLSSCECQGFIQYVSNDNSSLHFCYLLKGSIGSLLNTSHEYDAAKEFNSSYWQPNLYKGGKFTTFLKIVNTDNPSSNNNGINKTLIGGIIGGITLVFLAIIGVFSYTRKRQKHKLHQIKMLEERELQKIIPSMVTRFFYKDLHKATDGFKVLLGTGGCGSVYKGILNDDRVVAIKKIGTRTSLTTEQTKQFLTEVACVGRTSHQNIVNLLGFCWEESQLLLVYEYLDRGSLDKWLFDVETNHSLDWKTRYSIAVGIAQGLHYLHEECKEPILHFDIKSQNILLDQDLVPKVADFGLSRLMSQNDASKVVTVVRGTPGYIAPEWLSQGVVSKKADVYSMGMVFLELVTGRRVIDLSFLVDDTQSSPQEKWHLPSWAAMKCGQGLMYEIVDAHIQQEFEEDQLRRLIFTSFWCISEDPCLRPSIHTILQWLTGSSLFYLQTIHHSKLVFLHKYLKKVFAQAN